MTIFALNYLTNRLIGFVYIVFYIVQRTKQVGTTSRGQQPRAPRLYVHEFEAFVKADDTEHLPATRSQEDLAPVTWLVL